VLTQASVITLGLFVVGLVYHAGQMSQRVATLERDGEKNSQKIDAILKIVDELKGMIRGDVG
jgi:hypothetical protein